MTTGKDVFMAVLCGLILGGLVVVVVVGVSAVAMKMMGAL